MKVLWFAAGTVAGVYATAKARRAAEALTVDGIHDRLTGWFAGARVLGDELRAGTTEKETELRTRLSLGPDEEQLRALAPSGGLRLVESRPHETQTCTTEHDEHTGKGDS
jgi:hypothetical protein